MKPRQAFQYRHSFMNKLITFIHTYAVCPFCLFLTKQFENLRYLSFPFLKCYMYSPQNFNGNIR